MGSRASRGRGPAARNSVKLCDLRLRLYHHSDGARIAYREAGTGPPLGLLHSALLTHREFEPLVEELADRYRLVLPDLPLHGDSEDRSGHPYTLEWLIDVLAGFCRETLGPRPLVGGHDLGATLLLHAVAAGRIRPGKLVLLPNPMHRRSQRHRAEAAARALARAGALPGLDRALAHGARAVLRPSVAMRWSATDHPGARDLVRHALDGVGATRAHAWAKAARTWPHDAHADLLDRYAALACPTLLLWADSDPLHPLALAEEALDLLPDAVLRVLPRTGYLMAYDDPVGMARELASFC